MITSMRSYATPRLLTSVLFLVTPSCQCLSTAAASSSSKILVPPENLQAFEGLKPQSVWSHFSTLSSIPRPSKQEDAILQYITDFADLRSYLNWKQDAVGNLVVFHPGCGKQGPQAPPVILQGHVDMVTEKNSATDHNFETDPIVFRRFEKRNDSSPWLGARGTTLGADNGVGVTATLALLETDPDDDDDQQNKELPPLEALFTVNEETGLTGAIGLDVAALGLTGTTMLNLDTEEWGELYVGCAGGGESTLQLPLKQQTTSETRPKSTNHQEGIFQSKYHNI
jgi:dipeptidase D